MSSHSTCFARSSRLSSNNNNKGSALFGLLALLCLLFCLRNLVYLLQASEEIVAVAGSVGTAVDPEEGLPTVRDKNVENDNAQDVLALSSLQKEDQKQKKGKARQTPTSTEDSAPIPSKAQVPGAVTRETTSNDDGELTDQKPKPEITQTSDKPKDDQDLQDQNLGGPTIQKDIPSHSKANLLTGNGLNQQLKYEKKKLQDKLLGLYGEYYWEIFVPELTAEGTDTPRRINLGDHFFYKSPSQIMETMGFPQPVNEASLGWNRMVRLLKIKLLQVQIGRLQKRMQEGGMDGTEDGTYTTLQWITSGNGQASASGNLFRESFTAVLEAALQDTFQSFGIQFTAKNYAMKSMSSGDEIALCQDYIFPQTNNNDIVFWDFDMTDEKDYWKLALFAHRLTATAARPNARTTALMAYTRTKKHTNVLAALEQKGMAVLGLDWAVDARQSMAFPDSAALSEAERKALPPLLQYIRCGNEIEDGGPQVNVGAGDTKKLCRAFKFNTTVCPGRPHKYIWHPGFRTNAIKGYTLAWTLLNILEDAIGELPSINTITNPQGLEATQKQLQQKLDTLQQAERQDYEGVDTVLSSGVGKWYNREETKHQQLHQEIDLISLFRAPALCRTALLPSTSRYDYQTRGGGATITSPYNDTYEPGVVFAKVRKQEAKTKEGFRYPEAERADDMVIVSEHDFDCREEPILIDHQDAFLVSSQMGWRKLTIPNEKERQHFDTAKANGWIFICLFICNNSKCPENNLHDRVYNKKLDKGQDPAKILMQYGRVEMEVNGIEVKNFTRVIDQKISHLDNCVALMHGDNSNNKPHTWKANEQGTYVLRARIVGAALWSYIKISSVIVM